MFANQPALFDTPILPGLAYREALLREAEEKMLIERIERLPLAPFRFQGWLGKRETVSFGWRYDFDNGRFEPAEAIPDFLLPIRDRAAAFAGLPASELVQALLIRYDPGAGIGWHRDRPHFDQVVGLSLGLPATLRFRRRTGSGFERRALKVAPRSIYHLSGEARQAWEHSIAPMTARRWSITFRSLSAHGRQAIFRKG